ncbi:hypothetical protein [Rhabdochlamydiaceae symbiont of Dictyostelium giganteum]|uniref:hypothetical protein n=1 Tax=Rhabdochlamydiaceae symbiont of Dictyostelium giganteum TaxID=3342349 RepID=UPI00384F0EF9
MSNPIHAGSSCPQLGDLPSFLSFEFIPETPVFLKFSFARDRGAMVQAVDQAALNYLRFLGTGAGIGLTLGVGAVMVKLLGNQESAQTAAVLPTNPPPLNQSIYRRFQNSVNQSMYLNIIRSSLAIGVTTAHYFGLFHGAYTLLKVIPIRTKAFQHSHEASNKAFEIMNIFVENKIERSNWICPISQELLAFPVTINCGHVFELFSLSLMMLPSESRQSTSRLCPLCRSFISNIDYDADKLNIMHHGSHKIFEQLENLLTKSHIMDGATTSEIESLIHRGRFFLERPVDEITHLLHHSQKELQPDELFALAALILTQFKPMHHKIKIIYDMSLTQISELMRLEKITPDDGPKLIKNLHLWYQRRDFIPQNCPLTRTLFEKLGVRE